MKRKLAVVGAGGSGVSTLIAAMLTIESDISATYRLIEVSYAQQGIKVPTMEEFRTELKQRVEQSGDSYSTCLNRYRMGCLLVEQNPGAVTGRFKS